MDHRFTIFHKGILVKHVHSKHHWCEFEFIPFLSTLFYFIFLMSPPLTNNTTILLGMNGKMEALFIFMVSYGWNLHLLWTSCNGLVCLKYKKLWNHLAISFPLGSLKNPLLYTLSFLAMLQMILSFQGLMPFLETFHFMNMYN